MMFEGNSVNGAETADSVQIPWILHSASGRL